MSRRGPAVVQSPHYAPPTMSQIVEKHSRVDVVAVQVVQVYHVGVERLNAAYQPPCGAGRHEAVAVGNPGYRGVEKHRAWGTYTIRQLGEVRVASCGRNLARVAIAEQGAANSIDHPCGATRREVGVDVENSY